jgi:hypothetical protein
VAVDTDLGQVESDDAVERDERFVFQLLEHACRDPLVTAGSQRRVRHLMLQNRFDIDPRATGGEPDQDPSEAQPVRHPRAVTAQRMLVDARRQERLDRGPHRVHHLGLECARDIE